MTPVSPLVSTVWLDQNLKTPDLRIVDIRGRVLPANQPKPHYYSHRAEYDESHLPGAVFIDWVRDITVNGPDNTRIAPPDKFAAAMSAVGIDSYTHVVAYDDAGGMFAARLWWALNHYGHEKVSVLDGGWQKWIAEDRPTTAETTRVKPRTFTPRATPAIMRDAEQVAASLKTATHLIDVRTPAEFNGQESRAKRFGHIPGAANIPRSNLLAADGTLLPPGVLHDLFASENVDDGGEVVFYCNGGVSASFGLLAYRIAGYNGGAVYDGSWKDWGNDDKRPIEK